MEWTHFRKKSNPTNIENKVFVGHDRGGDMDRKSVVLWASWFVSKFVCVLDNFNIDLYEFMDDILEVSVREKEKCRWSHRERAGNKCRKGAKGVKEA